MSRSCRTLTLELPSYITVDLRESMTVRQGYMSSPSGTVGIFFQLGDQHAFIVRSVRLKRLLL